MKKKFLLLVALVVGTFGFTFAQVDVTATAGNPAATYTSLRLAFDAINDGTHQGDIDIRITADITETFTARLGASAAPASYTSVVIGPGAAVVPAVGVTVNMTVNDTLLSLDGASNVTIDGRVGATGDTISLFFANTNIATAPIKSMAASLINGATDVTIQYVEFDGATQQIAAGVVVGVIGIGDVTFDNCVFFNGRTLLEMPLLSSGNELNITNCQFYDFGFNAIFSGGNFTTINIDNSDFLMLFNLSNGSPTALSLGTGAITGTEFNITNNLITQIGTSAASAASVGGILLSPGSATGIVYNLTNNMISLMLANTGVSGSPTAGLRGIFTALNANPAVFNLYYNTVRLGGTSPVGAGINSFGYGMFNTANASELRFKNNISNNTRTGNGRTNAAWWFRFNGTTFNYSVIDIDYNHAFGTPFPLYYLSTGTSSLVNYKTDMAPHEQNTTLGAGSLTFVSNTNPSLAGASLSDVNLVGTPLAGITTDRFGTIRDVAVPYKGAFEGSGFPTNDHEVRIIHTIGKIAQFNAAPHQVRAVVRNKSVVDKPNYNVYLNVTGDNSFMDTVEIPNFVAGQEYVVEFNGYVNTNMGSNNVAVYIDEDDTPADDSLNVNQDVSANSFNYAYRTPPAAAPVAFGGLGLGANPSGAMVARFRIDQPSFVNQVKVDFTSGGASYQVALWSVANNPAPSDTPEVLLYNSATLTSVAGQAVVNIDPPVAVNGDFFVGVIQTTVTGVTFAYQLENPVRNDRSFYFRFNSSAPWNDFGVNPNNTFRFMIEPRLQLNDDIAAVGLALPLQTACRTANEDVTFTVQNVGANAIDFATHPITITGSVTGPNPTTFAPVDVTSGTLASGATLDVNVGMNYDMSASGNYNFQAEITSAWDINEENNILPSPVLRQTLIRSNTNVFSYDFTGFTGANLSVVRPGWREGFGQTTPLGTTSDWTSSNAFGQPTAKIRNLANVNRDWIVLPPFTCGPNTGIKFKAAVTAVNSAAADPTGMAGSDDVVQVLISTDCGASFSPLFTIDETSGLSNTFQEFATFVGDVYDGQEIMFAIFASDGDIDDTNDYEFHIDDVQVLNLNPVDLSLLLVEGLETGCGLSATTPVTFTIRNEGLPLLTGFQFDVRFRTNPLAAYTTETITLASNMNTGDSLVYTFTATANLSAPGAYGTRGEVIAPGDVIVANNSRSRRILSSQTFASLPYYQDFENGAGGWYTTGNNTSWERGTPNGAIINSAASGSNAWVTNLSGDYGPNERGEVNSPCFDFSSLSAAPFLTMSIFRSSEDLWDGAQVQYSINDGDTWLNIGTASANWYNSGTMGDAGVRAYFNFNQNWFTGNATGWEQVEIQLPGAVVGQASVRLRIAFASDDLIEEEGIAFDNIVISETSNLSVDAQYVNVADCNRMDFAIGGTNGFNNQTRVVATPAPAGTRFFYQIRDAADANTLGVITTNPNSRLTFGDHPGIFQAGNTYTVRVIQGTRYTTPNFANVPSCQIGFLTEPVSGDIQLTQIFGGACSSSSYTLDSTATNTGNALNGVNSFYAENVPNATSYDFEITDTLGNVLGVVSANFTGRIFVSNHTNIFEYNQTYIVRVRAVIGTVAGNWGNACTISFIEDPSLSAPSPTSLLNCSMTNVVLNQYLPRVNVVGASIYIFEFYTDMAATNLYTIASVRASSQLVVGDIVPNLLPGTTYYVIVRAKVGDVFTSPGSICDITTEGVAPRSISNVISMNAYPNPFTNEVSLIINHDKANTASVRIYDLAGRMVSNNVLTTNTPHQIGSNLATGTYIVEAITNDGEKQVLRIIKTN